MTQETNHEKATTGQTGAPMDVFNTAAGWVLIAGILGLGLSYLSSKHFHGTDPQRPDQLGYVIEGAEEESGAPAGPTFEEALTMVSASDGERVYAKCSACHSIDAGGANGVGPNLHGIMGADVGNVSGYSYSSAMSNFGGEWGWDEMNEWLANPRGYMDGTKMGFAGLSSIEDRAAVALYLNENGSGLPVPEFTPAEESAEEADAQAGDDTAESEDASAEAEAPAADAETETAEG